MSRLLLVLLLLIVFLGCEDKPKPTPYIEHRSTDRPAYTFPETTIKSNRSEKYTFQSGEVGILAIITLLPNHNFRSNEDIEIFLHWRVCNDYFIAGATLHEPHLDGWRELEWDVQQNTKEKRNTVLARLPNVRSSLTYEIRVRLHPKEPKQTPAYGDPYCYILLPERRLRAPR